MGKDYVELCCIKLFLFRMPMSSKLFTMVCEILHDLTCVPLSDFIFFLSHMCCILAHPGPNLIILASKFSPE